MKTKVSLKEKFESFDAANPAHWTLFKRFALEAIAAGKKHLSVSLITERIRWEAVVNTTLTDYQVDNNHRAFYARKFHAEFPQYDGFFRTRVSPGGGQALHASEL